MKIILITGMSGVGKTTIAKKLCKNNDKYNFIFSYTDRVVRERNEFGHTFVDSSYMDLLLERNDIVAQTKIEKNRYCTIEPQFDENKVNVYIVDAYGINDTVKAFPTADIMSILIKRREIEVDCIRQDRDVCVPAREDVDFCIDNNGKVESVVNTINALVNFDLFNKPSHIVETIEDKLEYIDSQYRCLDEIRESLLKQLWYKYEGLYRKLCIYVEEKVNEEFDFNVKVTPDEAPDFDGEYLTFNVIGVYDNPDIGWDVLNKITELLSYHAHTYCSDNNISNALAYRLYIGTYDEEEYV